MDLSTTYLGLSLKNPIVVASSGLTKNADQIKKCEQAGAAAVVLKSLFEEQIRAEAGSVDDSALMHTEAYEYMRAELEMQYGPRDYTRTIRDAKKDVEIPVIASINCHSNKWWLSYAKEIEDAGADALELNVYVLPYDGLLSGAEIEQVYLNVVQSVTEQVKIPVSLKLVPYFSSLGHLAKQLEKQGAKGLVLFNRFIQPDIDINKMSTSVKAAFDDPIGFMHALRWIGLLSHKLSLDIAASGNVRSGDDVIKQLLAGAKVVQIASVLYKQGLDTIGTILKTMETWMDGKGFSTVDDFRGKLSDATDASSEAFLRAQFIKILTGIE